ncbi:hypothetical protein [Bhargavaea ginsengi]|uniref:hypothetical protein n=1 Tax=Bhargavaea ginsengi TaxID=426757 RepID=UPI003C7347CE
MSRWEELRPKSDRKRRKSPHDGLKWLDELLKPQDEDEDKPQAKRRKGRRETARRLTSADQ